MKNFQANLEDLTVTNYFFRKVLFTGKYAQLVLMSLKPGEDIGSEVHNDTDQFFRFESGQGKVVIDDEEFEVNDGFAVIVPAGSQHNVINTSSSQPLKMYTLYSPPHHPDQTTHQTKADAMEAHDHH